MMRTESIQAAASAPVSLTGGYDPDWFEILAEVEAEHFWFCIRNQIITAVARRLQPEFGPHARLLEVGCGNGNVLRELKSLWPRGTAVGLDLHAEGLQRARKRCDCEFVQGDIRNAPLPRESFDLIGIFDVLEHLPDDENVLRILHSLLKPGGALLLSVPANPALWSYFDEVAGHCRRYQRREINRKLQANGFGVSYCTPFMATIFPLLWIKRRLASAQNKSNDPVTRAKSEMQLSPTANRVLRGLLRWEPWSIARGARLPFGTSLLALARKPSTR